MFLQERLTQRQWTRTWWRPWSTTCCRVCRGRCDDASGVVWTSTIRHVTVTPKKTTRNPGIPPVMVLTIQFTMQKTTIRNFSTFFRNARQKLTISHFGRNTACDIQKGPGCWHVNVTFSVTERCTCLCSFVTLRLNEVLLHRTMSQSTVQRRWTFCFNADFTWLLFLLGSHTGMVANLERDNLILHFFVPEDFLCLFCVPTFHPLRNLVADLWCCGWGTCTQQSAFLYLVEWAKLNCPGPTPESWPCSNPRYKCEHCHLWTWYLLCV